MPLFSRSQIVGGGANLLAPVTVDAIPRVVDVGPPGALSDSIMRQWTDGAVQVIAVGTTNVRAGIGATENFRLRDGFISEGSALDSFRAGRGATAASVDTIVIGRQAASNTGTDRSVIIGVQASAVNASGDSQVVIGESAVGRGTGCVVIGSDASIGSGAGGAWVVIGDGADARSNGGTPSLMAIGAGASAGDSGVNGVFALALGNSGIARGRNDVVIGHGASQNVASVNASNTVVLGMGSAANVSQGHNTVLGANSSTTGTNCVVIGPLNAVTANSVIVLGRGLTTSLANTAFIGTPNTDIRTVIIGEGDTVASPDARVIRFTNASGTDNAAGTVTHIGPLSTGAAAPAAYVIQVGVLGGTGATLQTATEGLRVEEIANAAGRELALMNVTGPLWGGLPRNTATSVLYSTTPVGGRFASRVDVISPGASPELALRALRSGTSFDTPGATGVASGQVLGIVSAGGWTGSAMGVGARVIFDASTTWSGVGGTRMGVALSPASGGFGSTAGLVQLSIPASGTGLVDFFYSGDCPRVEVRVPNTGLFIRDSALTVDAVSFFANGTVQFGDASTTALAPLVLDYGALGAGVPALRMNGLTNGAGAGAGTLTNAPAAGDPAFWVPININGTVRHFPVW